MNSYKNQIVWIGVFLFFLIFASCSSTKKTPTFKEKDVSMWLEKGSCYGKCAVYSLKIYQNKNALYTGKANTDKMGQYFKVLNDTEYQDMWNAFQEAGFQTFDSVYVSGVDDFPSITLGMAKGKQKKSVTYKENRPEELYRLQLKMEKLANSFDWTPLQKDTRVLEYKPIDGRHHIEDDGVHIKNEIIIQPKENVDIDQWIKRYQGYEVVMVKKIAPNFSYYLITWNTAIINPDDMLRKIKTDVEIQTAEFNKKIMKRED